MYVYIFQLFLLIIFVIVLRLLQYKTLSKIPGPSWMETFKFFFSKRTNESKGTYNYIITLPEKYGPVVKLWLMPFKPVLLIADPKIFEYILNSKEHVHKTDMYGLFRDVARNGLTTNKNVVSWRNDRKLLGPIFNKQSVYKYISLFARRIDKIIKDIELHENQILNIQPIVSRTVLGVVVEFLTNVQMTEGEICKFLDALDVFLEIFSERIFSVFKMNNTFFRMLKQYKPWKKSGLHMHHAIATILGEQKLKRNNPNSSNEKQDLLGFLLQLGRSDDFMLSHLETFTLAGSETVSQAISFSLFEISKYPDIQEKIYKEYLRTAKDNPDCAINFDQLKQMTYAENVVKEALRMHPPLPVIQRTLKSSLTINGFTVPDHINLVFSIASLHNLQFDRPKEFDPDRFLPENIQKIAPFSYLPFSLGPRDCIGKQVAMPNVKLTIVNIVKHFTLHSVPEHKLKLAGEMSLRSKNGMLIIFKKRK